jgi:hypothetical protein
VIQSPFLPPAVPKTRPAKPACKVHLANRVQGGIWGPCSHHAHTIPVILCLPNPNRIAQRQLGSSRILALPSPKAPQPAYKVHFGERYTKRGHAVFTPTRKILSVCLLTSHNSGLDPSASSQLRGQSRGVADPVRWVDDPHIRLTDEKEANT